MKIKRLDIGDFGIYSNQSIDQLNSNLVVVGGLNRAGKSSLLQILRHFGYGFPRDNSLPPAKKKYKVQAEIITEENNSFYLTTEGFGKAVVSKHNQKDVSNPYQQLSKYTYQQLFTISLDELNKLPEDNQKQQQLQSILLGAGFSDLLKIQNISQKLTKEAKRIGGITGDCDVYEFKEYNQQIQEGLEQRKAALKQINKFQELKQDLANTKDKINDKNSNLEKVKAKITILDILKSNYTTWEEKEELELELEQYDCKKLEKQYNNHLLNQAERLKQDYQDVKKDYHKVLAKFKEKIDTKDAIKAKEVLLNHREELLEFESEVSGLRERVRVLQRDKKNHQQEQEAIKAEIKDYNSSWHDFSSVLEIKTDAITKDRLEKLKRNYQTTVQELKEENAKQQELNNREEMISNQLAEKESGGLESNLKRYYFLAVIFLIAGGGLTYAVDTQIGFIVALTGIIGASINFLFHFLFNKNKHQQKIVLAKELQDVNGKLNKKQKKVKELKSKLNQLENKIVDYCEILELPQQVSLNLMIKTFDWLKESKKRIKRWQQKGVALDKKEAELLNKLLRLNELIAELSKYTYSEQITWPKDELFNNKNKLFMILEEICDYLRLAEGLAEVETEQQEVDSRIEEFLPDEINADNALTALEKYTDKCKDYQKVEEIKGKIDKLKTNVLATLRTERTKEAFIKLKELSADEVNDQKLLKFFNDYFQDYSSLSDVDEKYHLAKEKSNKLKQEIDQLKKQQQSLEDSKDALATNQKLDEAKEKIIRARNKLKPLAEEFAAKKTASVILNQARDRFINRIKDNLLSSASQILNDMTQGEYEAILPQDELDEIDFKLKANGKVKHQTITELSQGTKEQLFLSVRISRIRELEPNLPVILDDTFVNFDDYHLQQVVRLLVELSKTHQIFILTCDPKLLKHLNDLANNIQYWQLEEGKFKLSQSAEKLIDYLSV